MTYWIYWEKRETAKSEEKYDRKKRLEIKKAFLFVA
jgi:hypothetical protein